MPPVQSTNGRAKRITAGARRTPEEAAGNPAAPPFADVVPPPRAGSNAADRAARDAVSPHTARLRAIGDSPTTP